MRHYVMFKGSRNGLQLVLDDTVDFSVILGHLKTKLESAVVFFTKGTIVEVPTQVRMLTLDQQDDLRALLAMYGLIFRESSKDDVVVPNHVQSEEIEPLVVAKTIRSGQEVVYSGSVIIIGDVNPGAEVIAGGDIIIRGTCRGVVHAGAYGNAEATITANRLLASQIRIAGLIARAPDHLEKPEYTEVARIQDDHVIIETVDI